MANLDAMRDDAGLLPTYAWPGGYPIIYHTRRGLTICPECANKTEQDEIDDPVAQGDVFWEGPPIECDDCDRLIESAYGDPDGEDQCEGHETLRGDLMGAAFYCDGSCRG